MLAGAMQPPDGSHRGGFQAVTLPEASRLLGVSESTVRRMIKAGKLEADRVERSQGHLWLIKLPSPSASAAGHPPTVATVEGANPPGPEALAAWSAAVLAPLVARMGEQEGVIRDQAEQLGRLGERLDHVTTELGRARAEIQALRAPTAPESPEPAREAPAPTWRLLTRLWPLGAGAVLIAVLAVAAALALR